MLKIAKGKTAWFVIDDTFGVHVKFSAEREKDCVDWCRQNGFSFSKGWIW